MPKAGLYRILDYQQATEFFGRHAMGFRPIGRRARLQCLAASARQLRRHPCRYCQSMGASVRFKTGILHNIARDQQMKANPGVLAGCARLPGHGLAIGPRGRGPAPRWR